MIGLHSPKGLFQADRILWFCDFILPRSAAACDLLYISPLWSAAYAAQRTGRTERSYLALNYARAASRTTRRWQKGCHRHLDLPWLVLHHSLRQGSTGGEPWGRQYQQECSELPNSSGKFLPSFSLHICSKPTNSGKYRREWNSKDFKGII